MDDFCSEALDCIEDAVKNGGGGGGGSGARDAGTDGAAGGVKVAAVAEAAGVVEVGAGTGYWTSLLRARGIPVAAYDLNPCHSPEPNGHHKLLGRGNPPAFAAVSRGGGGSASVSHAPRA